MRKDKKTGKRAADDFDDMLAEMRAADLTSSNNTAATASANLSTSSSLSATTSSRTTTRVPEVSEGAINAAVRAGDIKKLMGWARQGIPLPNAVVTNFYPLLGAALLGKLDVVRVLLREYGVDVNQATAKGGYTALMKAAQHKQEHVVRCLVNDFGADVNQATHDGMTALYLAAHEGHEAIVKCIVEELDADVNQATHDGRTPLMAASAKNFKMVAKCLIKHGAIYGSSGPSDSIPRGQGALYEPRLWWRGGEEVHRMQVGALLWPAMPALAGAQGRV
jgi:hypothetical protein